MIIKLSINLVSCVKALNFFISESWYWEKNPQVLHIQESSPESEEDEEWVVESGFLRVIFQSEEDAVTEPYPGDETHDKQTISGGGLIEVEYQTRVEYLKGSEIWYFKYEWWMSFKKSSGKKFALISMDRQLPDGDLSLLVELTPVKFHWSLDINPRANNQSHSVTWWPSASGWGSGGPRFQSHPRLTFQSCSRYQLNQLGSKAASESIFKKSNTCGVSNNRLYFYFFLCYRERKRSFHNKLCCCWIYRS